MLPFVSLTRLVRDGRRPVAAALVTAWLLLASAGCPHQSVRAPAPPAGAAHSVAAPRASSPARASLAAARAYIRSGWRPLTRTHRELLAAARDPKAPHPTMTGRWPVYIASDENLAEIAGVLARVLPANELAQLRLLPLPAAGLPTQPGLLYLPRPYVVPGGRFNEMYGWDSYFIVLGLLRDGELELARDMTDNALYEVAHYGTVLNANRTYYLTRSQPPLLSRMVLAVFERSKDRGWLASAWPLLERFHATWVAPPHTFDGLGLARYHDRGEGPAPEVIASERDALGKTHYDRVRDHFRTQPPPAGFPIERYYDRAADRLTPLFYAGDRAMRESGFDPTDRFGPFGAETTQIAPVCLNVLLQQMEQDMVTIAQLLDRRTAAAEWSRRADIRRALIHRYLWDEQAGLYFDYDVSAGRRRPYAFATTFYPLWAGLASPRNAARVRDNLLELERPGGVMTSPYTTGNQWDAPFGWAPLQLFAVEGLRRAGYQDDARRIARAFTSMVVEDFARRGAIVEKYDVVKRTSDVEAQIRYGYAENQVGFGWTNGVFLELLALLEEGTATAVAPALAPPASPAVAAASAAPTVTPVGAPAQIDPATPFRPVVTNVDGELTRLMLLGDTLVVKSDLDSQSLGVLEAHGVTIDERFLRGVARCGGELGAELAGRFPDAAWMVEGLHPWSACPSSVPIVFHWEKDRWTPRAVDDAHQLLIAPWQRGSALIATVPYRSGPPWGYELQLIDAPTGLTAPKPQPARCSPGERSICHTTLEAPRTLVTGTDGSILVLGQVDRVSDADSGEYENTPTLVEYFAPNAKRGRIFKVPAVKGAEPVFSGSAPRDLWAASGRDGKPSLLARFNGRGWTTTSGPAGAVGALGVDATGALWVLTVSKDATRLWRKRPRGTFAPVPLPNGTTVKQLVVRASGDAWILTEQAIYTTLPGIAPVAWPERTCSDEDSARFERDWNEIRAITRRSGESHPGCCREHAGPWAK